MGERKMKIEIPLKHMALFELEQLKKEVEEEIKKRDY
jgi:hypothetical protein